MTRLKNRWMTVCMGKLLGALSGVWGLVGEARPMKRYAIAGRALRHVSASTYKHHFLSIGSCLCFRTGPNLFRLLQICGTRHSFKPQSFIQTPMIHSRTMLDYAHCVQVLAEILRQFKGAGWFVGRVT